MLIEYEQLLYYKGFMGQCQYIFGSGEWDSGTVRQWGLGTGDSGMGNGGRPEEMVNGELKMVNEGGRLRRQYG